MGSRSALGSLFRSHRWLGVVAAALIATAFAGSQAAQWAALGAPAAARQCRVRMPCCKTGMCARMAHRTSADGAWATCEGPRSLLPMAAPLSVDRLGRGLDPTPPTASGGIEAVAAAPAASPARPPADPPPLPVA